MPPILAAALAAVVAAAAWRAGTLTGAGAAVGAGVGAAVLAAAGWPGAAALAAFFVSSNAIARVPVHSGPRVGDPKGERRDPRQVLANGGPAALGALLAHQEPGLALWVATGSLASAAADTWATAAGAWSRTLPRHLLTWQPVPPGTNGGVTLQGCLGAVAGAAFVAGAAAWAGHDAGLLPAATVVGFAGMVLDSALGAAVQGRFQCPVCEVPSEWPVHRCGASTRRVGGWRWLDNDVVNGITTGFGALAGWGCWAWLSSGSH